MKTETTQENYTCVDCMVKRRGDCFGEKTICDDFRLLPNEPTKEELDNWPAYGDATYFRMTH